MTPKILLVDDNADLLLVTQIILKGQGYEPVLATSLAEAERKIRIHRPSLLLLDIGLGDADGRLLCRQIKEDPETSDVRVILMSGDEEWGYRHTGADDFLAKPFDFNDLIHKVQGQLTAEVMPRYTD
ncbi:MAG: response regulator [Chitinophagaceae bacterium]|nr:MAG: response regulator [Chitinophagaceae bacterium]